MPSSIEQHLYEVCCAGREKHLALSVLMNDQFQQLNLVHNEWESTPLHEACKHGWLDVVQLLIENFNHSLDVTEKVFGQTPLHISCRYDHVDIAIYLTKSGCNQVLRDWKGKEPIDYALDIGCTYIVYYLFKHMPLAIIMAPDRTNTTLNILRKVLQDLLGDRHQHLDWKTSDGDNIIENVCHSKLIATHMSPRQILKLLNNIHVRFDDVFPHICSCIESCVSRIPSVVIQEWLNDTTLDPMKLVISSNWKTADDDTLLQLVCQSQSCVSRISSTVMLKWLTKSTLDLMKLIMEPNYKTANGDTILRLICQSESCILRLSSIMIKTWLKSTNVDLHIAGVDWKTADNVTVIEIVRQLDSPLGKCSLTSGRPSDVVITPISNCEAVGSSFLLVSFRSELYISHLPSTTLLKWMQKTTIDLERIVVPHWKTSDGDSLLKLVCQSQSCVSRISSRVMLKWLTDTALRLSCDLMEINYKTADNDSILQLVCQSEICVSHISSTIMLKWLNGNRRELYLVPNYKTGDGDSLLQIVCQSEFCVLHITSATLKTSLTVTDVDLAIVASSLEWKTADGVTIINIIRQLESQPLEKHSSTSDTPIDIVIIPNWENGDDRSLYVLYRSEYNISLVSSTSMLKWLQKTNLNIERIVIPHWKTSNGDMLVQLVCQSKSCVSRISSSVLLYWLLNTTCDVTKLMVPSWKTADGDTLLELVCHSESLLIRRITSQVILDWLNSSDACLRGNISPSWKTADGDTIVKVFCTSQFSLSHISSSLMFQWLNDGDETTFNILKLVHPDWTTADGDAILHLLCQSNMIENKVIELLQHYLQERVINLNIRGNDGNTAIHFACKANKPAIVTFLVTSTMCDINVRNHTELLPIEMTKNPQIILSICECYNIDISAKAVKGWLNIITTIGKQTILKIFELLAKRNKLKTCDGSTLLHLTCGSAPDIIHDAIPLVEYLLDEHHCDPNCLDKNEQMPLQLKSVSDSRIMKILVQHGAKVTSDIMFKIISNVAEHTASEILRLSTTKKTMLWTPTDLNDDGDTALHLACKVDKPEAVKYLLKQGNCNSTDKNSRNELPIELTTNIESISLLVEHGAAMTPELILKFVAVERIPNSVLAQLLWAPDAKNSEGNTALHLACRADQPDTVNLLLSQAQCDPNVKNNNKEIPLQMTTNSDIIKDLIRHGAQTSIMYKSHKNALGTNEPIKPSVKIFVVGDPSVGKSTLTAALKTKLKILARLFTSGKVSGVDKKTVGIIPHTFDSEIFGRVTVYDFAGHREFYSGHAALLKATIQSTPPVFLLVVNLLNGEDEIIQNILYWISFLENQCTLVSCKPHLIIVGSHADTLKSKGINPQEKVNMLVNLLDQTYLVNLEFIGFIPMDCQLHESTGMNDLRPLLDRSCSQLRIQEPITFNAHCFLVYLLETFKHTPAVTVSTIHKQIQKQLLSQREGVLDFLPKTIGALYKICLELNERGHILFLKDKINVENSYVVIEEKFLLSKVSGTVFASEDFKQYKHLASNTGVVSLSKITKCFPHQDLNILVGFLTHLEFCHEISDQALFQIISEKYSSGLVDERYYLFPGLISAKAKESVWEAKCDFKYHFGWILKCIKPEQFFSSRFLQVLLLRLAFSFALESSVEDSKSLGIHRKCSLWKNGIFWGTYFGMETLVEIIGNKSVAIMSRFLTPNLVKSLRHRSQVIHTILECVQEFCPRTTTVESFLETASSLEYPFVLNSKRSDCTVKDLAKALVSNCDNPCVVLSESGNSIPADSFFSFEPYAEIETTTLEELWDNNNDDKVVSDIFLSRLVENVSKNHELLIKIFNESAHNISPCSRDRLYQEILNWRDSSKTEPVSYSHLRKKLDEHSIFAGRNVLVSIKS